MFKGAFMPWLGFAALESVVGKWKATRPRGERKCGERESFGDHAGQVHRRVPDRCAARADARSFHARSVRLKNPCLARKDSPRPPRENRREGFRRPTLRRHESSEFRATR